MIFEVKGISLSYPQLPGVVRDASFTLCEGETMTILGPNGAGKSTLLNSLMGLHQPDCGEIDLCGARLSTLRPKKIANFVAYVRQYQSPVFAFSVFDYVMMGRAPKMSAYARPREADRDAVSRALATMGIEDLAARPYTDISGGQRQQVVIARALAQEPRAILLDEPTAHLDFGNQLRIVKLVRMLAHMGYAVVMTTHDPNQAIMLGGTTGVLDRGGNLVVGQSSDMLDERSLSGLYRAELKVAYVKDVERDAVLAVTPKQFENDGGSMI